MKTCRECKLDKDTLEFYKVKTAKDGLHSYCKECVSNRCRAYRIENSDSVKERKKKYYQTEAGKASKKASYERNIEHTRAYDKFRFQRDKEKVYARVREYRPRYFENNPGLAAAYSSLYRGLKHNASSILTEELKTQIRELHRVCKLKSEESGIKHHVDHIIPLKSQLVCGLNVPWNLQIITQAENHSKINKFDGTYENESWRNDLARVQVDIST